MRRRIQGLLIPLGILLLLWAVEYLTYQETFFSGVQVEGLALGGQSYDAGREAVLAEAKKRLAQPVKIHMEDLAWTLTLEDLGIALAPEETLQKPYALGRTGFPWVRLWERWQAWRKGPTFSMLFYVEREKSQKALERLAKKYTYPPRNADITIGENDQIELLSGSPGLQLDLDKAFQQLEAMAQTGTGGVLNLDLQEVQPEITLEKIRSMGSISVISTFQTSFDPTNSNRTYNLHVAADALNNHAIPPNATFSFNEIVGPRSTEAGYKEAKVIVKNEFVEGIGGGVCQVSTTLYNTILRGGLPIVERTNHTLPVSYVQPGLDATVAYGVVDLKFLNNTDSYLFIRAKIQDNRLLIKLIGRPLGDRTIEVFSTIEKRIPFEVIRKEDLNLSNGNTVVEQTGTDGYQTKTYRVIKEKGIEVKRELISSDTYKPVNQILRVGTGLVPSLIVP